MMTRFSFPVRKFALGLGGRLRLPGAALTEEPLSQELRAWHPDAQGLEGCWAWAQPHSNSPGHFNGVPAHRYPMPGHGAVRLWPDLQQLDGTLKPSFRFFLEVCIVKQIY